MFTPMFSYNSTDLEVMITCQEMQQYTRKSRREEDYKQANMDLNNKGFKLLRTISCKCFMMKKMHSSYLSDLEDTHNTFW